MTILIDRHSGVPLYGQIARDLERRVDQSYEPGDWLPSVADLAQEYDVHRLTVSEALTVLVRRGLVTIVKGRGTFVTLPVIRWDVRAEQDASLTKLMSARGHRVENRLVRHEEVDEPAIAAELGAGSRLERSTTVRYVDEEPWSLSTTWTDPARFPGLADRWGDRSSLHAVLTAEYGTRMTRQSRSFAALPADDAESTWLQVPVGSPILSVRGLNVDDEMTPVAVVEHRFRGDRIQFSVDLA